MSNRCEGCPRNCFVDFKINTEVVDPVGLKKMLQQFPFIKKVRTELVRGPRGRALSVGVYSCDEFDPENGECLIIYDSKRPDFCVNTGKTIGTDDLRPYSECIL